MSFSLKPCFYFITALYLINSKLYGQSTPIYKQPFNSDEVRKQYWSFGLSGLRHTLKTGNEREEVIGNALDISIGYGYINNRLFTFGTIDFILGPYEKSNKIFMDIDHKGTGATFWVGYSAQELDLRSPLGGYGFILGLKYSDFTGRSVGQNQKESADPQSPDNLGLIKSYDIRVTNFSITPGIFFCWLEDWRPAGNDPELLKTRTEGYILTLGVSIPFQSRFQADYLEYVPDQNSEGNNLLVEEKKETGALSGYSILVNFTALLGI